MDTELMQPKSNELTREQIAIVHAVAAEAYEVGGPIVAAAAAIATAGVLYFLNFVGIDGNGGAPVAAALSAE